MDTNNDIIAALQNALNLMTSLTLLQEKRRNIRSKYIRPLATKRTCSGIKLILRFLLITAAVILGINLIGFQITEIMYKILLFVLGLNIDLVLLILLIINIAVGALCSFAIIKRINKNTEDKNNKIIESNKKTEEQNNALYKAEVEVIEQIKTIQRRYETEVLPWYPNDYCYIEAADFFLNSILNYRADNLKEAINLYEDYLHKTRIERAQQQMVANQDAMVKQQMLGNMLAVGNMVMQAGIDNSIKAHSANMQNSLNAHSSNVRESINNHTRAVNDLKRKL